LPSAVGHIQPAVYFYHILSDDGVLETLGHLPMLPETLEDVVSFVEQFQILDLT